jgi:hypothetical protein
VKPWLSIVIPTTGQRRDGLLRTLNSIQQQPAALRSGVEVVVVVDTHGYGEASVLSFLEESTLTFGPEDLNYTWLELDAGIHCYGQPQRTYGAQHARGEWMAFSQDDNCLVADALHSVWLEVCRSPRKRPLFFKVLTPWREEVWREELLYQGNIDADCLVFPRALAQEVTWGLRYEGDFDAAVDAMQRAQGDVGWCGEQIAIARPEQEHIWW